MRPTTEIVEAMFAAAHRDLDRLRAGYLDMVEQANARQPDEPALALMLDENDTRPHPDTIRAKNVLVDPTGEAAIRPNPARGWLRNLRADLVRLHTRVAQMEDEIGAPVCQHCRNEIRQWERTGMTKSGDVQHANCRHWSLGSRLSTLPEAA